MANTQVGERRERIRGALGLILLGLLMSIGPAVQARVDQEFYPTRHAAVLAARKMGGPTTIMYDKDMGRYMVTLYQRPHARHTRRHHHHVS